MICVSMSKSIRLGNNMFQYAVLRTVAEKNGYNFYVDPKVWYGHGLFDCDLGKIDGKLQSDFHDLPNQKFNHSVFNVSDFTSFQGYFQCERYFDRADVKKWFKTNVPNATREFQREFSPAEYCYINVRGTDQKLPHLTLPDIYYAEAMAIMLNFNPRLKFVVITDDEDLGKKYFPDYPVYTNDRDTDFCLLNEATFLIGAISTFAWWAGYLNDYNVVVMPKYFYHHNTQGVVDGWGPENIHTNKFIWI